MELQGINKKKISLLSKLQLLPPTSISVLKIHLRMVLVHPYHCLPKKDLSKYTLYSSIDCHTCKRMV